MASTLVAMALLLGTRKLLGALGLTRSKEATSSNGLQPPPGAVRGLQQAKELHRQLHVSLHRWNAQVTTATPAVLHVLGDRLEGSALRQGVKMGRCPGTYRNDLEQSCCVILSTSMRLTEGMFPTTHKREQSEHHRSLDIPSPFNLGRVNQAQRDSVSRAATDGQSAFTTDLHESLVFESYQRSKQIPIIMY